MRSFGVNSRAARQPSWTKDLESALAGRFRIEREPSGGGMSRVFVAAPGIALGYLPAMITRYPPYAPYIAQPHFKRLIESIPSKTAR
jgi:hypothetical protein